MKKNKSEAIVVLSKFYDPYRLEEELDQLSKIYILMETSVAYTILKKIIKRISMYLP